MLDPRQKAFALSTLLACVFLPEGAEADELPAQALLRSEIEETLVRKELPAVGVTLDFAKILSFGQPARTIIIGNPGIVDGTLSDEYTIVLTGKALGTTNMIVLGETGQEIANLTVKVAANTHQWTTIHHGSAQQVFSCTGPCKLLTTPSEKK